MLARRDDRSQVCMGTLITQLHVAYMYICYIIVIVLQTKLLFAIHDTGSHGLPVVEQCWHN